MKESYLSNQSRFYYQHLTYFNSGSNEDNDYRYTKKAHPITSEVAKLFSINRFSFKPQHPPRNTAIREKLAKSSNIYWFSFNPRHSPLNTAIREELANILPAQFDFLTDQILASNKLKVLYEEIGEREPNKVERREIRRLLANIYGGMLRNPDLVNPEIAQCLSNLIKELVSPFYADPSNKHVRIGCFFHRLKAQLELGRSKYQVLYKVSLNTFKKYASASIPTIALSRGRNGRSDYLLVDEYLNTVL